MTRVWITTALMALTAPAYAQQPTPAEIVDALNMKVAGLESTLNQTYVTIAQQKSALVEAQSRLKWTLDHWVSKKHKSK